MAPNPGRLGGADGGPSVRLDAPVLRDTPPALDVPVVPVDGGPACPTDCDDSVACTTDTCDATGACRNVPNDAACGAGMRCVAAGCVAMLCAEDSDCDDGNPCNGDESCNPGGGADPSTGCRAGDAPDCDDGFDCTTDACTPGTGCTHAADSTACDDMIDCTVDVCRLDVGCVRTPNPGRCASACIATPVCSPTMGCIGTPMTCSADGNPCTSDPPNCDVASGMCLHPLRDADLDGHAAASVVGTGGTVVSCMGGTDCNDGDGSVHPGATEVCNGRDDDCDGMPDDGLMCGTTAPENCATARAIALAGGPAGVAGSASGSTMTSLDDYTTGCGRSGGRDVVHYIDLPPASGLGGAVDVVITTNVAGTSFDTVLGAQVGNTCGAWGSCNDDVMGSNRSTLRLCVTPGTTSATRVYILVDGFDAGSLGAYTVNVTVTPRPTGVCG